LRRIPEPLANADDSTAMELKGDLPKPGRARVLRNVGERTRGSETNEGDFADSIRDSGSMSRAQATMGRRITRQHVADEFGTSAGASPAIAAFASDDSCEAAQVSRRSAAALPYQVREF